MTECGPLREGQPGAALDVSATPQRSSTDETEAPVPTVTLVPSPTARGDTMHCHVPPSSHVRPRRSDRDPDAHERRCGLAPQAAPQAHDHDHAHDPLDVLHDDHEHAPDHGRHFNHD